MSQAAASGVTGPQGNATAAVVAPFTGGARLAADTVRLDFGSKSYGESVDAQFTVSNVGDASLIIDDYIRVETIAGC